MTAMLPTGVPPRQPGRDGGSDEPLVIGLVNNMPDAALSACERQFRGLLSAAQGDTPVHLRFYHLAELPRGEAARGHLERDYEDCAALWDDRVDGVIVTGTEPRAAMLEKEPYWSGLARLIDWAREGTSSSIWSCLAAHAAVQHLDGIRRRPLGRKLSGVFACAAVAEHPLLAGLPACGAVPHSRLYDIPEAMLTGRGYTILSRSAAAGADLFVADRHSLFVFLQGHPEYDAGALPREYRRDVGRFLSGERDRYPEMPTGCFDAAEAGALASFRERALRDRDPELLARFPISADARAPGRWHAAAVRLYANWLACLRDRRRRHDAATACERAAS